MYTLKINSPVISTTYFCLFGVWNTANMFVMPVDESYSGPLKAIYRLPHEVPGPAFSKFPWPDGETGQYVSSHLKGNWHIGHIGILKAGLKTL